MKIVEINNLDKTILPTKKVEEFRHFDIYSIFEKDLDFKIEENIDIKEFEYLKNDYFYNIYFVNNKLLIEDETLKEAINIQEEDFEESFNKLYKLNSYFSHKTLTLKLLKPLDKPLNIINIFKAENSFIAQSLNIEIFANNYIIETFENQDLKQSVLNLNRKYELKENITANISRIQTLNNASIITNIKTVLKENSTLNFVSLDYKATLALNIFDSKLESKNSSLNIDAIVKNFNEEKSANIAFIEHLEESTISDIKIKHLLDKKAQALFDISSTVQNSAKFAKAFQNSQTILLSDEAKINANPRLQIYVDELEASHGASCGTLNEDELYYLCSRGISKNKAKQMIIESIELKVIRKIDIKAIRRYIKDIKRINHV